MHPVSQLHVDADVANLVKIREFVQQSTSALGVTQEIIDDIVLAVDEAVTNIIVHGYKDQPGIIEIEVRRESDTLFLHLQDQAPSFNPTQVPSPDLTLSLEKRPLGHLGVLMIRHIVDEMIYEIRPGGGNLLTLVKNVSNFRSGRSEQ